uniref:F-box domain-containing protein n=1 Tax=Caenorhabditis tropicalis TaxID=1561998 RepID=A0A1I7UK16_9PELO
MFSSPMASPSFRLFQLPQVAMRELLKLFSWNELFILSLCSRRSSHYVKLYYNKSLKSKLFLDNYRSPLKVEFKKQPGNFETIVVVKESTEFQSTQNVTIGGYTVLFLKTPENCELYWDDQRIGFEIVVEYICELFSVSPFMLTAKPPFLWMIELMSNPISITDVNSYFSSDYIEVPLSEEECKYLITTCKTYVFFLDVVFPEGFSYTGSFGNHEMFSIFHGSWITDDNLISMGETCIEICIRESKLTVKDLNKFMRSWFNHKANAVRLLDIEAENIDYSSIFEGLEDEMITVEGTMVYCNEEESVKFGGCMSFEFPAGHSVLRRDDGMIAAAALSDSFLYVAIWPDIGSIRENGIGKYKLHPIDNI